MTIILPSDVDPYALEHYQSLFPQADAVRVERIEHAGFSQAQIQTLQFLVEGQPCGQLIAKYVDLETDWLSQRSGDSVGRELACIEILNAQAVHLPYVAVQDLGTAYRLMMHDVSAQLLPNNREPLTLQQEAIILSALVKLHVHYWQDEALAAHPALMNMFELADLMAPQASVAAPAGIGDWMAEGWAHAEETLPDDIWELMCRPSASLLQPYQELPCTLIHGDAKLANMYWVGDNGLGLFDWAFAAYAPACAELGWYLAVNASRLASGKEDCIERYRRGLTASLSINDTDWSTMLDCGLLIGARMLLWTKARNLKNQVSGAQDEWKWWLEALQRIRMKLNEHR